MNALVLAAVLSTGCVLVPLPVRAQDVSLEVNADAIKVSLERQVGKRVRLRLVSGRDVEGTVVSVGMDFFDGVVRLDQIAAGIVRARN
ncbi:MAG TPA: hypothetical protein VMR23_10220 [Candidatus Limnocylindria bacterium]|nr:hypothetical protein [Candidatus Limnocylindria bacterium]